MSAAALASPPVFDRARSALLFDGTARKLIHGLKFNDQHGALPLFARWLHAAGAGLIDRADVLVPVPLSRRRLWSRRFNQSALLARHLGTKCVKPVMLDGMTRVRHTRSQIGLTDAQREKNVAGAFRIPKRHLSILKNRSVLLVDDVITTGATVNACARSLKRAGAAEVNVITIARVLPDHVREAIDLI